MTDNIDTTADDTTTETQIKDPAALLHKNRELLAKLSAANARVAELEAQAEQAAADLTGLKAEFDGFHIRRPLARLAEEISPIPDLWTAEFQKHFDVKAVGDDLGIFTKDGERCVIPKGFTGAGEPVKFTANGVWGLLAWFVDDRTAPEVKRWAAMMNYFGPSGTGATGSYTGTPHPGTASPSAPEVSKSSAPTLGLR